jgi:hypothetical protein
MSQSSTIGDIMDDQSTEIQYDLALLTSADSFVESSDSKIKDPFMYFFIPENSNRPSTSLSCELEANANQSLNETHDDGIEISIL